MKTNQYFTGAQTSVKSATATAAKTYTVISVKQLEKMLEVARKVSEQHGLQNDCIDCMIYEGEISQDGQVNFESVRAAASNKRFQVSNLLDGTLMAYRG